MSPAQHTRRCGVRFHSVLVVHGDGTTSERRKRQCVYYIYHILSALPEEGSRNVLAPSPVHDGPVPFTDVRHALHTIIPTASYHGGVSIDAWGARWPAWRSLYPC